MPHSGEALMISEWPKYSADLAFKAEEADFEKIMAVIKNNAYGHGVKEISKYLDNNEYVNYLVVLDHCNFF